MYIPDTVESIADNAFDSDVTIVSAYNSFAHDYSKNNNIRWINTNEHDEPYDSTDIESYLLEKIDIISLSEATDDEMRRKIEEYNELCSQVNDLIDQYNESILALNEAVDSLYDGISIEETNDNTIINLDDFQIVIDSNVHSYNLENAEIIDTEDSTSDVVIKCQDESLLYLSSTDTQIRISSQPSELLSRGTYEGSAPNFYDRTNTKIQRAYTCANITEVSTDALK